MVSTKADPARVVFSILVEMHKMLGAIVSGDINIAVILKQTEVRRTEKHRVGVNICNHIPLTNAGQHFQNGKGRESKNK